MTWRLPGHEKKLYLTFDDGPIPEITPWILEQLQQYAAHATFFCLGKNVELHPEIYRRILSEGHSVGNHTYNHLNGWKTPSFEYLRDVRQCADLVESDFFRPPYGKIRPSQIRMLRNDYRIIMWDVISRDYDQSQTGDKCFELVRRLARPGSIIVFHDSKKAMVTLKIALPKVLRHFAAEGFSFEKIPG